MAIVCFHPQKLSPEELAALKASLAQPFMVGLGMASENWAQLNWGTTVLDVCCGTSTIGPTLALEGKGVVGVELCQEPVEATRVNTLDNKLKTSSSTAGGRRTWCRFWVRSNRVKGTLFLPVKAVAVDLCQRPSTVRYCS
ncbi:hypothetical protein CB1_000288009 [Camelus ferus]|nr:hypothetical protein CB1_000288009 [Camelus ferus]